MSTEDLEAVLASLRASVPESQLSGERIKWTGSGVIGMDEFGDFCL